MAGLGAQIIPSGVVLARDETIRRSGEFLTSNIFFFVKMKLALTNKRLAGEKPNTFLGFIPVGSDKVSYPLSNIAGVQISTRIAVLPLLIGAVLLLIGFAQGAQNGWVSLIIGALLLISCYQAQLNVQNSGGGTISHRVSVFNKSSAQDFAQEINTALAERA